MLITILEHRKHSLIKSPIIWFSEDRGLRGFVKKVKRLRSSYKTVTGCKVQHRKY